MKKRDIGLDLIRIVAFISVVAIHFFLNSGYYNEPVVGKRMYIMTLGRTFFGICVPLFMLLSGYLMVNKSISIEKKTLLNYYKKISKVLGTYIIATGFIIVYKMVISHDIVNIKGALLNLLGYNQYSWYVNMYIGLYLLIPFLNLLWNNIEDKSGHFILVVILVIMTIAPSVFNIYNLEEAGMLVRPYLTATYNRIIPDWWMGIYPITYYYIGAYIKHYVETKKISTKKVFILLIGAIFLFGANNIWRSYSREFFWGTWCDWGSLQDTVETILVFLLINSIDYKVNDKKGKVIAKISNLTFGAYLLSWIPDNIFYSRMSERIVEVPSRMKYCVLMVIIVATVALMLSWGVQRVQQILKFMHQKVCGMIYKAKEEKKNA